VRARLLAACVGLVIASASAQPAFDVASIKISAGRPLAGDSASRSHIDYTPTGVTMRNVSLGDCVQWAYDLKFYQLPETDPLNRERFDIGAKAQDAIPVAQLRRMFQELLTTRFKLAVHRERKPLAVYELAVAKGGSKLPLAKVDAGSTPVRSYELLPRVSDGNFVFHDVTMADFAEKLALLRTIEKPVIDKTGIQGRFDITWKGAAAAILHEDGPSLFTLIQEQLGLKLESAKAPVDVLVIDHVERPSVN
jgi:uncharacterized protein (TIGR03435 family)